MVKTSLLNRKKEFWEKFEDSIFDVIKLAIEILNQKEALPVHEDHINRIFYGCLVEANFQLQKVNMGRESPPIYESCNQPYYNDDERAKREDKRPDFQWSITDVSETDPKKSSKQFVLECKRLGNSKGKWILNSNYINNGIKRFISIDHGYGRGVKSSAMLGYIQSMEIADILDEINYKVSEIKQPLLKQRNTEKTTTFLTHDIELEFCVDIMRLEHIWIDIKRFYGKKLEV